MSQLTTVSYFYHPLPTVVLMRRRSFDSGSASTALIATSLPWW